MSDAKNQSDIIASLQTSINELKPIVKSNESKIGVLVSDDTDQSARTIAHDEATTAVAAIVAGAPEAFSTLKGIADWITTAEGTTTAQLLDDVRTNTTNIGNLDNQYTSLLSTLTNTVIALSNKINEIVDVVNAQAKELNDVENTYNNHTHNTTRGILGISSVDAPISTSTITIIEDTPIEKINDDELV